MTIGVLIIIGLEILVGFLFATRARDVLHFQITTMPFLTWKSKTISVEQELTDLKIIGVLMIVTGSAAGLCIVNMDHLIRFISSHA